MDKKKIILDCDPGMDDSMAIVLACKSEALDVLAVTTVNGNYPAEVTCVNALKVLEMIGRTDVPVGKGMVLRIPALSYSLILRDKFLHAVAPRAADRLICRDHHAFDWRKPVQGIDRHQRYYRRAVRI